jgi:hypothetical protein
MAAANHFMQGREELVPFWCSFVDVDAIVFLIVADKELYIEAFVLKILLDFFGFVFYFEDFIVYDYLFRNHMDTS